MHKDWKKRPIRCPMCFLKRQKKRKNNQNKLKYLHIPKVRIYVRTKNLLAKNLSSKNKLLRVFMGLPALFRAFHISHKSVLHKQHHLSVNCDKPPWLPWEHHASSSVQDVLMSNDHDTLELFSRKKSHHFIGPFMRKKETTFLWPSPLHGEDFDYITHAARIHNVEDSQIWNIIQCTRMWWLWALE